ncbi:uncharacterized protein VP01_488g3 [Puccinia sorghi]|uniref:CCHC-type domain-containing protein n=1 Tax=Puccinia sorghi TaxID=27349 RepID=A0A0L6UM84_9BASI|nr:uncharacterized protein VP01_488g3 [Puccinia sorghi]
MPSAAATAETRSHPLAYISSTLVAVTHSKQPIDTQGQLSQALEDNRSRRLADEDRRNTVSIIAATVILIRKKDHLLPDSSNYRKWARWIQELASQFIYDTDFFSKPNSNVHHEWIGQAILLHSVESSLEDKISGLLMCFIAFKSLKTWFSSACRSAQITMLMKLLRVDLDNHPTTAFYAAKMKDIVANLKDLNIKILVATSSDSSCKSIRKMGNQTMRILPGRLSLHRTGRKPLLLQNRPVAPTRDVVDNNPFTSQATHNTNCHICNQPGHWSNNCPHRKKPSRKPYQPPNMFQNPNPYFNPYCPIFVAPDMVPGNHPYSFPNFPYPSPQFTLPNTSQNAQSTNPHANGSGISLNQFILLLFHLFLLIHHLYILTLCLLCLCVLLNLLFCSS